jgi:LPXTG-site transpeptidase (sortase) family protein
MSLKSSVHNAIHPVWPRLQVLLRKSTGSLGNQVSTLKPSGLLGPALILAGLCLLGFVGVQYGRMFTEQRRLANEWQQQNQPGATSKLVIDDGLIKLVIPKINLDAMVVEGTTRHQLLLGPGHMEQTPLPGEDGNSVITAHRDTFFRHIYELNKGDVVEVRRKGKIYSYQVTGKKIIDPEDLSVLQQGKEKRLTLITCYPTYYIGPAPDRLVVFAKLIDNHSETSQEGVRKAAASGGAAARLPGSAQ